MEVLRIEPGEQGPGPHVHLRHTDAFVVLAGELVFELGGEDVHAAAGTFVAAPPGLVHTFRNDGGAEAETPIGPLRAALRLDLDGTALVGTEIDGALALVVPR